MRKVCSFALAAVVVLLTYAPSAWALCSGPVAMPEQLAKFDNDSVGWLRGEPPVPPIKDHSDLVARAPTTKLVTDTIAVANAAISSQDVKYPTALQTMLATASGDQGAFIGQALASLGTTCTTAQDERYLASIATSIASSENARANMAYGEASNPVQTAATGGGGGSGTGGGGTMGFGPASFFRSTTPDESTGTPNIGHNATNIILVGGLTFGPGGLTFSPTASTTILLTVGVTNTGKTTSNSNGNSASPGGSTSVSAF